jgi:hypothetical protein
MLIANYIFGISLLNFKIPNQNNVDQDASIDIFENNIRQNVFKGCMIKFKFLIFKLFGLQLYE